MTELSLFEWAIPLRAEYHTNSIYEVHTWIFLLHVAKLMNNIMISIKMYSIQQNCLFNFYKIKGCHDKFFHLLLSIIFCLNYKERDVGKHDVNIYNLSVWHEWTEL